MKAIVHTKYGPPDVLALQEVERPTPKDNEVLISVCAASINSADYRLLSGIIPRIMGLGLITPNGRIPGADVAGRVAAVGRSVTQFQPGDEVFGNLSGCGWGSMAEHVCAREDALALKPANLSFEEAAAVPMAALTALQGLRDKGQLQAGQQVVINGASGGVGTFAVQIAKALGAEVTAVCSTSNLAAARALGADHVIDYTQADFTKNGRRYDLIIAANGYHPLSAYQRALRPGGRYVMAGGSMSQMFQALLLGPLISLIGSKKLGSLMAQANQADLRVLTELIEAGKVKPAIDRCYPLHAAAEALRYLGEGHARGKVVITVA